MIVRYLIYDGYINFDFAGAIVKDIAIPGAFDEAIIGAKYVIHSASPFNGKLPTVYKIIFRAYEFAVSVQDNESELLKPAIQGTRNILQAAKSQSSVKHFVFTSSVAAIIDVDKQLRPGYTYTSTDWNPASECKIDCKL